MGKGSEREDSIRALGTQRTLGKSSSLGKEVGRRHFGHTRSAKGKKGELKGQAVAFSTTVKLIFSHINPIGTFFLPHGS
jgi:hypothetical protein